MAIAYFDIYERRDGEWLYVRRRENWYAADRKERPTAPFTGWSAHPAPPDLPQHFDSWNPFWDSEDRQALARMTEQPTGE